MPYIGIDFGTSNSVVANFQYVIRSDRDAGYMGLLGGQLSAVGPDELLADERDELALGRSGRRRCRVGWHAGWG